MKTTRTLRDVIGSEAPISSDLVGLRWALRPMHILARRWMRLILPGTESCVSCSGPAIFAHQPRGCNSRRPTRSIAVVERCIRTVKEEFTRRITIPLSRAEFRSELLLYVDWFNDHRPHTSLHGRTPNEVYFGRRPTNQRPRIEPRAHWPRPSPCARPRTLVAGELGNRFTLNVEQFQGRRHLRIVTLRRAA